MARHYNVCLIVVPSHGGFVKARTTPLRPILLGIPRCDQWRCAVCSVLTKIGPLPSIWLCSMAQHSWDSSVEPVNMACLLSECYHVTLTLADGPSLLGLLGVTYEHELCDWSQKRQVVAYINFDWRLMGYASSRPKGKPWEAHVTNFSPGLSLRKTLRISLMNINFHYLFACVVEFNLSGSEDVELRGEFLAEQSAANSGCWRAARDINS